MRKYTKYVCEVCGKESDSSKEIRECEALHIGLTLKEANQYEKLIQNVENSRYVANVFASVSRNEQSRLFANKKLNNEIEILMNFEREHGLDVTNSSI